MEDLAELFFELSSSDRLALLLHIQSEKLRLTQLAQKLSATVQETSRHLERLSNAKLVEKDSSGLYTTTAFGKLALSLIPSFTFVSKNRDYLLSDDLSVLPPEFVQRIGDLSEHQYGKNVSDILRHLEEVIVEAKEYIWLMADQPLIPIFSEQKTFQSSVAMRVIIPREIDPADREYARSRFKAKVDVGFLDEVKVGIAMNEKLAGMSFPDLNGRIDMSYGFRGTARRLHKFCHDVFLFYWNEAKKNSAIQIRDLATY